jgi:hypothetical protein
MKKTKALALLLEEQKQSQKTYLDLKKEQEAHEERIRLETIRAREHYANLSVD